MKKYRRITTEDRDKLVVGLQKGLNQKELAALIGFNQSSISRELKKGFVKEAYSPQLAYRETIKRLWTKKRALLIDPQTWEVIKNHLSLRWSPKQIEQYLRKQEKDATIRRVSEKTIYNYLHVHLKGELKKACFGLSCVRRVKSVLPAKRRAEKSLGGP